jgi:hypothetical protein
MLYMKFIPLYLMLVIISACSPLAIETSAPTETPVPATGTPEPTHTPTVVWFPPTATFTPFPTPVITPTANLLTDIGQVLLTDDFSSAENWTLQSNSEAGVALSKGELTAAIKGSKAYIYSIREEPLLDDFYIEITANPNLCKGADEYGLLLRVSDSDDYYRYSLSCDSQVRLDRVIGYTASSPQPWMLSGDVPPGAPSISRLGAWLSGDEMRFFVNGQHQFTVTDPLLSRGRIGIFARSTGANAVTVNFSNLVIRAIQK